MTTPDDPFAPVGVRPETVLYAARYCLGRATYAGADGAALLLEHADLVRARGWAEVMVRDIDEMLAHRSPLAYTARWREARAALLGELPADGDPGPRPERVVRVETLQSAARLVAAEGGHVWPRDQQPREAVVIDFIEQLLLQQARREQAGERPVDLGGDVVHDLLGQARRKQAGESA